MARRPIRTGYGVYYDSADIGRYEQQHLHQSALRAEREYLQCFLLQHHGRHYERFGRAAGRSPPRRFPRSFLTPAVELRYPAQPAQEFVLDVGYYGSKGTHLQGIVDINQVAPGVALAAGLHTTSARRHRSDTTIFTTADDPRINAVRPYLGFNAINTIETAFDSNYHSLQVHIRKSFGAAGQFNVAYTWSKNLTDSGSDSANAPQSSYNWHEGEYGPLSRSTASRC